MTTTGWDGNTTSALLRIHVTAHDARRKEYEGALGTAVAQVTLTDAAIVAPAGFR